jgi:hypothetical protein
MNALHCYLDDSVAKDAAGESVGLGGALGSDDAWTRVVEEWEPVIRDSMMGWFHATEWRCQEHQVGDHWRRLIEIMDRHLIAYVGCVVPGHAVETLKQRKAEQRAMPIPSDAEPAWVSQWSAFENDPLTVCLSWCLLKISGITRATGAGKVSLTFAKTDRLQARAGRLEAMRNMIECARDDFELKDFNRSPRTLVQLQAADLVAYELTAYQSGLDVREQYKMLRRKLKTHKADPPGFANLLRLWGAAP